MYNYNLDYISHHGIKGQKWGVKNGPPYPLVEKQKVLLKKGYYCISSYKREQGNKFGSCFYFVQRF